MVPYTHGLRCLDKVYLDTTFAVNSEPYRSFPTKAQGVGDLLREVSNFSSDTVFHFNAWTFGYEEVWMALAAHLVSQIHVDEYKWRLYKSLSQVGGSATESLEGAALCGFQFGNRTQDGCLTQDDSVRLHSCERGTKCSSLEKTKNIVWITPLINRSDQGDIPELGAGGGGGDLTQTHELEMGDPQVFLKLVELCRQQIQDDAKLTRILDLLEKVLYSDRKTVALDLVNTSLTENSIPLEELAQLLTEMASRRDDRQMGTNHQSSCQRGESASPNPSPSGPGSSPLLGHSAAGRSTPAIREASGEDLGSVLPNKPGGTAATGTSTTRRATPGRISRGRSEQQDGGVINRSFSGWLDPKEGKSKSTKRHMSETNDEEHANIAVKRERNTSPRTASLGPSLDGEPSNSNINPSRQRRGKSNLPDMDHHKPVKDGAISSRPTPHKGTNTSSRQNLPVTATGTQHDPIALSDTSDSEMTTDEDHNETQSHDNIDEAQDRSKLRSASPVSMAESTFDPLDRSSSGLRTDPRRVRYRKEVYGAVKRDVGFVWGREYSLVSTKNDRDPDELEL
ncbi:MAG: hypothetical protein Q9169_001122 [Polycauliona sp. 2 TL-2023]